MTKIEVQISANAPLFVTADPDSFGKLFAQMSSDDQVEVFKAMERHMRPHRIQWDYIGIKLEEPDNIHVQAALRQALAL